MDGLVEYDRVIVMVLEDVLIVKGSFEVRARLLDDAMESMEGNQELDSGKYSNRGWLSTTNAKPRIDVSQT